MLAVVCGTSEPDSFCTSIFSVMYPTKDYWMHVYSWLTPCQPAHTSSHPTSVSGLKRADCTADTRQCPTSKRGYTDCTVYIAQFVISLTVPSLKMEANIDWSDYWMIHLFPSSVAIQVRYAGPSISTWLRRQ